MNNGNNRVWDVTIKVVLVIIIIILLMTRFTNTIKNGGEDKVEPTGNITIIEFKCDKKDDNCTPIEEPIEEPIEDPNEKPHNNNNNSNDNNDNNPDVNNEEPVNNGGNNNENNEPIENNEPQEEPVEELSNEVEVFDKEKDSNTWSGSTNLNIFKDSMYVKSGMIAPESTNTYKFVVKNGTSESIKYNINFVENNPSHINMKYKLKKNDEYVISEYVSYDELNLYNVVVSSGTSDTYLLEWKWVSSSNDNEIGKNGATYGLQIDVEAESV